MSVSFKGWSAARDLAWCCISYISCRICALRWLVVLGWWKAAVWAWKLCSQLGRRWSAMCWKTRDRGVDGRLKGQGALPCIGTRNSPEGGNPDSTWSTEAHPRPGQRIHSAAAGAGRCCARPDRGGRHRFAPGMAASLSVDKRLSAAAKLKTTLADLENNFTRFDLIQDEIEDQDGDSSRPSSQPVTHRQQSQDQDYTSDNTDTDQEKEHDPPEPSSSVKVTQTQTTQNKVGVLLKKSGTFSNYRKRFFVAKTHRLEWFKDQSSHARGQDPHGFVQMAGCSAHLKDSCTIQLVSPAKTYTLVAEGPSAADEASTWLTVLQSNISQMGPHSRFSSDITTSSSANKLSKQASSKKTNFFKNTALRAEKKIACRAVTADWGKKLLRQFLMEESFGILDALQEIADVEEEAKPVEERREAKQWLTNDALRFGAKLALLFHHGRLERTDWTRIIIMTDRVGIGIVRKYDLYRQQTSSLFGTKHGDMVRDLEYIASESSKLLEGEMKQSNISKLRQLLLYFADEARIERVLSSPVYAKQIEVIAESLRSVYRISANLNE